MTNFEQTLEAVGGEQGIIECLQRNDNAPLKLVLDAARKQSNKLWITTTLLDGGSLGTTGVFSSREKAIEAAEKEMKIIGEMELLDSKSSHPLSSLWTRYDSPPDDPRQMKDTTTFSNGPWDVIVGWQILDQFYLDTEAV